MTTVEPSTWIESNQRALSAAIARVCELLEQQIARGQAPATPSDMATANVPAHDDASARPLPPALEMLCAAAGLSPFECDLVLLCAGMELDSRVAGLCAAAQGDPARPHPTFSLALAAFPQPHWSAVIPEAPLRYWRIIELADQAGALVTTSRLRIDERILHFLTGMHYLDERLSGLIEPVLPGDDLVPSHQALARRIVAAWTNPHPPLPLIQLCGTDETSRRLVAAAACAELGLRLYALDADTIPVHSGELAGFIRLWEREAILADGALYVEAGMIDQADRRATALVARLLERVRSPILLGVTDRWRPLRRPTLTLDVRKPTAAEQCELWQVCLGERAVSVNGHVQRLVSQFNLSVPAIDASAREALSGGADGERLAVELWDASRAQVRPSLDSLAQRIEPVAIWEDLVLPASAGQVLQELADQVAHRSTVYETWGFGAVSTRGLGISALFAGASGTGKTMAAEVLAHTLRLDLYRIDLSSVVSKYIGETEKNLRRIFDAAEDGGTILFFDEADALFGKRSEVKDSHDRYANIEINYLLQRMEAYRGLAILATNRKGDLDPAFLRRIRFVVHFPFPDIAQRVAIWQRVFPPATPTEGLDLYKLARLNVTGGNIRNIALNAAFVAAAAGEPVRMQHLARAARGEYAKLEKPLNENEISDWVAG